MIVAFTKFNKAEETVMYDNDGTFTIKHKRDGVVLSEERFESFELAESYFETISKRIKNEYLS